MSIMKNFCKKNGVFLKAFFKKTSAASVGQKMKVDVLMIDYMSDNSAIIKNKI